MSNPFVRISNYKLSDFLANGHDPYSQTNLRIEQTILQLQSK
jgi:hypothetical protein